MDLIYEFYESKGFLDENSDDNAEIDIDEDERVFMTGRAQCVMRGEYYYD